MCISHEHHVETALALAQSGGGTGDFCRSVVKNPMHDPNLMGIDRTRLTFKFQGRHFRLTDVHGEVVRGILA